MSSQHDDREFQTVAGLSHAAIRTRVISDSIRYYTEVLGLREAFRMFREDGSLIEVMEMPPESLQARADKRFEKDDQ